MANTNPINYSGLLIFPNILKYILRLCPKDSGSAQLLNALGELRFQNGNLQELQAGLTEENKLAFDLLADRLIRSMESYQKKCNGNQNTSDTNVVGGGMLLQDDMLRVLAIACAGTEASAYFDALHQVHSGQLDIVAAEAALPVQAQMVFIMTCRALFGEPEQKLTRSEINRRNALKRWSKKTEKNISPEVSDLCTTTAESESEQSHNTAPIPAVSSDTCPAVTEAETPPAALSMTEHIADSAETIRATDSVCIKDNCSSCKENAKNANACKRDANADLHPLNIKKKRKREIGIEKDTHPFTPSKSHEKNAGECVLRNTFERLCNDYPKREDLKRAWGAFQALDPDEVLLSEIHEGLTNAKKLDKRFMGDYRYIPTLRNWLLDEGWKPENMHYALDPTGRHSNAPVSSCTYEERSIDPAEADKRNLQHMLELEKIYGELD